MSKWENTSIGVLNNPLDIPPLITVKRGRQAVLRYFQRLEAEQKIDLKPFNNNDIKLIFVGNSSAGKSTLLHLLKTGRAKKDIPSTHWLDVVTWEAKLKKKTYNIRVFDFGGQEYYHDTHHLFFTNRTSYLVLWDRFVNNFGEITIPQRQTNNDLREVAIQTFPLNYWLDAIKFHTQRRIKTKQEQKIDILVKEKDKALSDQGAELDQANEAEQNIEQNIIVVQNKVDNHNEQLYLNEEQISKNHPKVYDFCSISVFEKKGILGLKQQLFEIFGSLDIINSSYLGTWKYIKDGVEKTHRNNR